MTASPIEYMFALLLLIPGMLAVYWPRISFKLGEAQMASDLVRLHPEKKWIIWGFPLGSFLWGLLLVGGMFLLISAGGVSNIILYIGHFSAAMGLFYGGFAAITGVMVLPKRRTFPMWCITGDRAYSVGTAQAFISVIAIVLNSVLISMFAP